MKLWVFAIAGFATAQLSCSAEDLYTNAYVVPPTFLRTGEPAADPFAPQPFVPAIGGNNPTAKSILENAGITFGAGASAIYNPKTSQLIVRNTEDQMELVEAYLEVIKSGIQQQMRLEIRFASLNGIPDTDEVFKILRPKDAICRAASPDFDYPEHFLAALRKESEAVAGTTREILGTFSEQQMAVILESLETRKKATLADPIERMCRSGQWIVIENDNRTIGISTVLGADEFTVDVHTFLPSTAKPFEADIVKGYAVPDAFSETVGDGQTLAISESGSEGEFEVIFISTSIVDGDGRPVRTADARNHVVKKGETLEEIAAANGLDTEELLEMNRLPERNVEAGEILRLPPVEKPDPEILRALKQIILPEIDFDDTSFGEALGLLEKESLRVTEGTRITVPDFLLRGVDDLADDPLTLHLRNVPLSEALRYTTTLMGCQFEIKGDSVLITPLKAE